MVSLIALALGQINFTVSLVEPRDTFYAREDVLIWITLENTTDKKLPVDELRPAFGEDPSPWRLIILDEKGDTVEEDIFMITDYFSPSKSPPRSPDTLIPREKKGLVKRLAWHRGGDYAIWDHAGQWLTVKKIILKTRDGYYYEGDLNLSFYAKPMEPEVEELYKKALASPRELPHEEGIKARKQAAEQFLVKYPSHPCAKHLVGDLAYEPLAAGGRGDMIYTPHILELEERVILNFPHFFIACPSNPLAAYQKKAPEFYEKLLTEFRLKAQDDPYLMELMKEKKLLKEDQK